MVINRSYFDDMEKYKAKKSLGQNFLIDNKVLDEIINLVNPSSDDLIIEIGPGKGALTERLTKFNSLLLSYEIDQDMKSFLDKYELLKTHIIYKDFLKTNLKEEIKNYEFKNIYVVANIPYYITTAIIKHLINTKIEFTKIILMVEDGLANRFCSKATETEYSGITVFLNYYYNIKKEFTVSNTSFDPIPKVKSAIISLTPSDYHKELINIEIFKKIINDAFLHRRKTLKNNLKDYDLEKIEKILIENGYTLNNRAQDINIQTFIKISQILS